MIRYKMKTDYGCRSSHSASKKKMAPEEYYRLREIAEMRALPDLSMKSYAYSKRAIQKKIRQVQSNLEQARDQIKEELCD